MKINNYLYIIIGGIVGGIIVIVIVSVTIIFVRNPNKKILKKVHHAVTFQKNNLLDLETIFKLKSDLTRG